MWMNLEEELANWGSEIALQMNNELPEYILQADAMSLQPRAQLNGLKLPINGF